MSYLKSRLSRVYFNSKDRSKHPGGKQFESCLLQFQGQTIGSQVKTSWWKTAHNALGNSECFVLLILFSFKFLDVWMVFTCNLDQKNESIFSANWFENNRCCDQKRSFLQQHKLKIRVCKLCIWILKLIILWLQETNSSCLFRSKP